jgi:plasmid stabilization system protein ParE
MNVKWTDSATRHLSQIHDYIAQDSPRYALAMVDRITLRSKQCGKFPLMAAKVPEYDRDDIREVLELPYRIIYRVLPDRVDVLAVIHGARQLPKNIEV